VIGTLLKHRKDLSCNRKRCSRRERAQPQDEQQQGEQRQPAQAKPADKESDSHPHQLHAATDCVRLPGLHRPRAFHPFMKFVARQAATRPDRLSVVPDSLPSAPPTRTTAPTPPTHVGAPIPKSCRDDPDGPRKSKAFWRVCVPASFPSKAHPPMASNTITQIGFSPSCSATSQSGSRRSPLPETAAGPRPPVECSTAAAASALRHPA
jgi:hypothetical protein